MAYACPLLLDVLHLLDDVEVRRTGAAHVDNHLVRARVRGRVEVRVRVGVRARVEVRVGVRVRDGVGVRVGVRVRVGVKARARQPKP